jgi:hypothetical protein
MCGEDRKSAFEPWIGQVVVVQLTLGRIKLSLRGTLLKDRNETLLVRPEVGSDVEVPKTDVLAIEQGITRSGEQGDSKWLATIWWRGSSSKCEMAQRPVWARPGRSTGTPVSGCRANWDRIGHA